METLVIFNDHIKQQSHARVSDRESPFLFDEPFYFSLTQLEIYALVVTQESKEKVTTPSLTPSSFTTTQHKVMVLCNCHECHKEVEEHVTKFFLNNIAKSFKGVR